MKPKITVEGFRIARFEQSVRVLLNGVELVTAYDLDYESSDATKCCELLAAMRNAGIIDLEINEEAQKQWASELANVRNEPRHE